MRTKERLNRLEEVVYNISSMFGAANARIEKLEKDKKTSLLKTYYAKGTSKTIKELEKSTNRFSDKIHQERIKLIAGRYPFHINTVIMVNDRLNSYSNTERLLEYAVRLCIDPHEILKMCIDDFDCWLAKENSKEQKKKATKDRNDAVIGHICNDPNLSFDDLTGYAKQLIRRAEVINEASFTRMVRER